MIRKRSISIALVFVLASVLSSCIKKGYKFPEILEDCADKDSVELILSTYDTDKIPLEIGELVHVKVLRISQDSGSWVVLPPPTAWAQAIEYPPFRYIPDEIVNLKSLRRLSLPLLAIKRLPPKFYELNNLEYLDLSFNKLDISRELAQLKRLTNLKSVNILGNKLDTASIKQWQSENPKLLIRYSLKQH